MTKKTTVKQKGKVVWNLGLLYKSVADPQIEKDIVAVEKACEAFEKKYKSEPELIKNDKTFLRMMTDFEQISALLSSGKPYFYTNLLLSIESQNEKARSLENKIYDRLSKAQNKVVFFDVLVSKMPTDLQKKYLAHKDFVHYKHLLSSSFAAGKHVLSEPEEKVIALKNITSEKMWQDLTDKVLNPKTVEWKGKQIPLPEAYGIFRDLSSRERRELGTRVEKVLETTGDVVEAELTALYTSKKIEDELRGYAKPYHSRLLNDSISDSTVQAVKKTVLDSVTISHRFSKIKAKLLNEKKLEYIDRMAKVGNIDKKMDFDSAFNITRNSFQKVGQEFVDIVESMLVNGQIDVFPKKGKVGGAFCAHSINTPIYVMLNHTDNFNSLKTLAHELGHTIHSSFSQTQKPIYQSYSTAAAEVASTLFENFVFDEVFPTLTDKEKIIALHDKVGDEISTIYRQIACFTMEEELHATLRAHGSLTTKMIKEIHNKHMSSYLGSTYKLVESNGSFAYQWSHIRRNFYVYSYAFGSLVSSALYKKYQTDPSFIEKIKEFLKAGGNDTVENIFKKIGIDVTNPSFFKEGLKKIEEQVITLEKLVNKQAKSK